MSLKTLSGNLATTLNMGANGLVQLVDGQAPLAAAFNGDYTDEQAASAYGLLAGVLAGSVITASALNLTIPGDLAYFARQVWLNDGTAISYAVADASTLWLWGCSDGQLRTTGAATTFPGGFDGRSACILCKVVSSGGAATVDNTARQWARYADAANRAAWDNGGVWAPVPDVVPDAGWAVIPADRQVSLFDQLAVYGTLSVFGKLRII